MLRTSDTVPKFVFFYLLEAQINLKKDDINLYLVGLASIIIPGNQKILHTCLLLHRGNIIRDKLKKKTFNVMFKAVLVKKYT